MLFTPCHAARFAALARRRDLLFQLFQRTVKLHLSLCRMPQSREAG